MKVRIELEVPNWTRWLGVGFVAGAVLGYGVSAIGADLTTMKTWIAGETLTSASLNQNFQLLRDEISAQRLAINSLQTALDTWTKTDCPAGYSRDPTVSTITVCKKDSDEVVKVGTGAASFWIDRFEASVWDHADGTGSQYGLAEPNAYPATFRLNGQYSARLYSISARGRLPSAYLTWFQADAACEASGKRLPSKVEWLRAARGTLDPGASSGVGGTCATAAATVRATGSGSSCQSTWGAEDMIGNLWEFTDEWYASLDMTGDALAASAGWSEDSMAGDSMGGVLSKVWGPGGQIESGPGAGLRGGSSYDGTMAGVFAFDTKNSPMRRHELIGFRCVIAN